MKGLSNPPLSSNQSRSSGFSVDASQVGACPRPCRDLKETGESVLTVKWAAKLNLFPGRGTTVYFATNERQEPFTLRKGRTVLDEFQII
jgi:hypothetical protein